MTATVSRCLHLVYNGTIFTQQKMGTEEQKTEGASRKPIADKWCLNPPTAENAVNANGLSALNKLRKKARSKPKLVLRAPRYTERQGRTEKMRLPTVSPRPTCLSSCQRPQHTELTTMKGALHQNQEQNHRCVCTGQQGFKVHEAKPDRIKGRKTQFPIV